MSLERNSRGFLGSYSVRAFLIPAALAWIGLIFLAPYARLAEWGGSSLIYQFFHQICHQIPERSFAWDGAPLAVCHRCLGIYLGFAAGLLAAGRLTRLVRALLERPRLLLLFCLPLAIDVLVLPNTWWTRFLTGWIAGLPVSVFVQLALEQMMSPLAPAVPASAPVRKQPKYADLRT